MKKTTIIIICVVYLLSILAVQFFGVPYSFPESGEYIESIQIESVTLSNRGQGQDASITMTTNNTGLDVYKFNFIKPEEGKTYTDDEESLRDNPNRVKITYKILPEGVSQGALKILVSGKNVVLLPKTEEFEYEIVLLKENAAPTITIKEDKASLTVQARLRIWGI